MAQYQIFLLPLLALLIAVIFPILDKNSRQSNSLTSRRRRRILLGRFAVMALLLASVITEIWPTEGLMPLFQGLLVTVLLLVPVITVLWLLSRRSYKGRSGAAKAKANINHKTAFVNAQAAVASPASGTQQDLTHDLPKTPNLAPVLQRTVTSEISPHTAASENAVSTEDADDDVKGHLERVADVVQSYDLDELGFTSPDSKDLQDKTTRNSDQSVSDGMALDASTGQATDLARLDTNQITQLVTTLRKDKKRLQKLVIAQQAAIQNERHAHEKTRVLTRDAISVMRSARTAQKHAEKLARRERSERQRLEQQYKKVAYELSNALSIVEKRRMAEKPDDPSASLETLQMSDKILF